MIQFNNEPTKFLMWSARLAALLYGGGAACFTGILNYFDVDDLLIIQLLLVYLIGALAHILTWGFQASGFQSVECTSRVIESIDRR